MLDAMVPCRVEFLMYKQMLRTKHSVIFYIFLFFFHFSVKNRFKTMIMHNDSRIYIIEYICRGAGYFVMAGASERPNQRIFSFRLLRHGQLTRANILWHTILWLLVFALASTDLTVSCWHIDPFKLVVHH